MTLRKSMKINVGNIEHTFMIRLYVFRHISITEDKIRFPRSKWQKVIYYNKLSAVAAGK